MGRLRYIPINSEMKVMVSLFETPDLPVNSRTAKRLSKWPCYACVPVEGANDPRRWVITDRGRTMMEGLTGWISAWKSGLEREKEIARMRWPPDGKRPRLPHERDEDDE